jgi:hypothetical protein
MARRRARKYPNGFLEECSAGTPYTKPVENQPANYQPSALILTTLDNISINPENQYKVRFQTGFIDGDIIANDNGQELIFENKGTYRFELVGIAVPRSEADITLIYDSPQFDEELESLANTLLPYRSGQVAFNTTTVLPIEANQSISVRLVCEADETALLLSHTRLIIHRIA